MTIDFVMTSVDTVPLCFVWCCVNVKINFIRWMRAVEAFFARFFKVNRARVKGHVMLPLLICRMKKGTTIKNEDFNPVLFFFGET